MISQQNVKRNKSYTRVSRCNESLRTCDDFILFCLRLKSKIANEHK